MNPQRCRAEGIHCRLQRRGVGVRVSAVMIAALQLMWREGGSSSTQLRLSQEFIFRTRESPLNQLD